MSLNYEPSSEPLHISVKQLFYDAGAGDEKLEVFAYEPFAPQTRQNSGSGVGLTSSTNSWGVLRYVIQAAGVVMQVRVKRNWRCSHTTSRTVGRGAPAQGGERVGDGLARRVRHPRLSHTLTLSPEYDAGANDEKLEVFAYDVWQSRCESLSEVPPHPPPTLRPP